MADIQLKKSDRSDPGPEQVLTPQQQRLRGTALATYREIMVGQRGWGALVGLELYNLLCAPLPGMLGFGLRSFVLKLLLGRSQSGCMLGRGVCIRQPAQISLGSSVIIDEGVVLDVRTSGARPDAGIEIADNVFIGRNTIVAAKGAKIKFANACNISSNCRIATENGLEIGEGTLVAAYAYIGPGNHRRDDERGVLAGEQTIDAGGVSIGKNVWVGARATILDGVTVGDNAVIGAHSLVREDVPEGAVVAGTPARIIA